MADKTIQYVGARYVPKFADPVEWQSNTAYEALTIVTYNNSSYTSKIPVSAGVGNPADNGDYWALTGNYNSQVEEYRQETEKVKDNQDVLDKRIAQEINDRRALIYDNDGRADIPKGLSVEGKLSANDEAEISGVLKYGIVKNGTVSLTDSSDNPYRVVTSTINRTVVNVKECGLDNTGVNDCSDLFQSLLNENGNATFFFEKGTYLFNKGVILNNSCGLILDDACTIKCGEEMEWLFNLTGGSGDWPTVFGIKRYIINGGTINCNGLCKTAILVGQTFHSRISDVKIRAFTSVGIRITSGAYCLIDHCLLMGVANSALYGYKNEGTDSSVFETSVVDCRTGYFSLNDRFEGCTAWITEESIYSGTVAFENSAYATYTNCISDTMQISWKLNAGADAILTGCRVICNEGVATPDANTLIFSSGYARVIYSDLTIDLSSFTFSDSSHLEVEGTTLLNVQGTSDTPCNIMINGAQTKANIDLSTVDTFTSSGTYCGFFELNDLSLTGWGLLIVLKTILLTIQVALCNGKVKIRTLISGTWSAWV